MGGISGRKAGLRSGSAKALVAKISLLATSSALALLALPATSHAQTASTVAYLNALRASGNPFLIGFANGVTPLSTVDNFQVFGGFGGNTFAGVTVQGPVAGGGQVVFGVVNSTVNGNVLLPQGVALGNLGILPLAPAAVQAQLVGFNVAHGLPIKFPAPDGGGLYLNHSSVSGVISNAGTITGITPGFDPGDVFTILIPGKAIFPNANGIFLNAVTAGGITNSGLIASTSGSPGAGFAPTKVFGINLQSSAVSGTVLNSGTLSVVSSDAAASIPAYGVFIDNQSTVGGAIVNTGILSAAASNTAGGEGIFVAGPVLGGITNAGTISVAGGAGAGAINVVASLFSGGITNSGTIIASLSGTAGAVIGADIGTATTLFAGGISNGGLIAVSGNSNVQAIRSQSSTFTGGIANSGTLTATGGGFVAGINIFGVTAAGGVVNTGRIIASNTAVGVAQGIVVQSQTFSNGVNNSGTLSITGPQVFGINVVGTTLFAGGITNGGVIAATSGAQSAQGIVDQASTFTGGVTNSGTLTATGGRFAGGINIVGTAAAGRLVNSGVIGATSSGNSAVGIAAVASSFVGGISNSGTVSAASLSRQAAAVETVGSFSGGITNSGLLTVSSGGPASALVVFGTFAGGVTNAGTLSATSVARSATGLQITASSFSGGVTNFGVIVASGNTGIGVGVFPTAVGGGITNLGTIIGSTAAINLAGEGAGQSTVITQAGGLIQGAVKLSANADQLVLTGGVLNGAVTALAGNAAVVSVPSGRPTLAPTSGISSVASFTQTGGTLALQLTSNTAAGTYPTVNASAINLNGTLLASLQGNLAGFATSPVFKDVFVSGAPITGTETVTTASILFNAALVPDAATANGLDLTVSLSPTGEAQTAQVLAQALRFGLVGQQNVIDTIENRLQVGRSEQGPGLQFASANGDRLALSDAEQAQVPTGGTGVGAAAWGRAYGTQGNAGATGALPAFSERRIGVLSGVDWHFDQFVLGGAFHYDNTNAPFADGSTTKLDSYEGLIYGGWRSGPAYVTALASGGANDYTISRNLMPFGLTGFASSSPTGALVTAFGEAGYGFDWNGATLTPYVNLDYVHQHVGAFAETGSFGALSVAPANGNSLSTTLGLRASTRIDLGSHGTLVPEVRAGWAHEFLNASQTLTTQFVGTAASPFTVVGTSFGRDSALVGVGVSHEFAPGASFFMDYDGQFTGGFNQNSGSVGIKVKF